MLQRLTPIRLTTLTNALIADCHLPAGPIAASKPQLYVRSTLPVAESFVHPSRMSHSLPSQSAGSGRAPVYFVSHGGPPTILETEERAYKAWQNIGARLKAQPPRGIVVVSAHWEAETKDDTVFVNEDTSNPLVYDFYGFPDELYKLQFRSKGDPALSEAIYKSLGAADIPYRKIASRGLDHGIWIPLKAALGEETSIPMVQVSLPGDRTPESALSLGRALAPLRDEGYLVMGTGQIVHNLRDLFGGRSMPYTDTFIHAASTAVQSNDPSRVLELFHHPMYRQAHPTPEHLLPILVAAGAAEGSKAEEIWVGKDEKFGLGWGNWIWT